MNFTKMGDKKFFILLTSTFILSFIYSCAKKPNYSKVPDIAYKSFYVLSQDSALLTITFSDGDGDIGGGPSQDGNFFITYYFWNNSTNTYQVFKNNTFLQDTLDVRSFPSPSDAYKNKPISGEISILMSPFRENNTIKKFKYKCFIKDNAGNRSNIIETPELNAP